MVEEMFNLRKKVKEVKVVKVQDPEVVRLEVLVLLFVEVVVVSALALMELLGEILVHLG